MAEATVGTNFLTLSHRAKRFDVENAIQQANAGRSHKQGIEYQWQDALTASPIWRKITVAPMRWPKGQSIVSIQEITDQITHQIQLENYEAELLELKTNFSSLVHDLRSPLTSFKLYLDLLQKAKTGKKEKYLTIMHQEIMHMNKLVDDLLALSRLEIPDVHSLALVDIMSLVQEVVVVEQPIANDKGLTLRFLFPNEEPVWVWGQSRQLLRVVTNLVSNALRYTAVGTVTIQLKLEPEQNRVELTVSDTGIGIAPEVLPFIFEPFFRSPRAQAVTPKGTGLGLAIVKRIIALHNGSIDVFSELNQGTSFRIFLPLVRDTAVSQPSP
ncbi:MAG: HAMP domain-containing histidine kinase [Ardenticatenaceae bacterium]|nr:HAMP domain-containing histidine kinase [Ardenticatenaceae bacterium]